MKGYSYSARPKIGLDDNLEKNKVVTVASKHLLNDDDDSDDGSYDDDDDC